MRDGSGRNSSNNNGRRSRGKAATFDQGAVPFGDKFRLIDFTLSNYVNSGLRRIYVLTQYLSESLNRHIQEGWAISIAGLGDYIYCVPAQQKLGTDWYRGTGDVGGETEAQSIPQGGIAH